MEFFRFIDERYREQEMINTTPTINYIDFCGRVFKTVVSNNRYALFALIALRTVDMNDEFIANGYVSRTMAVFFSILLYCLGSLTEF